MFPSGAQEKFNKKGDGQREMMPRGARSSESDRITGKLPQKDAGQRTSSVGSDGSTQGGKTEAKPTEHAESKGQECFRWGGVIIWLGIARPNLFASIVGLITYLTGV